jgi:hypothetical protein
MPRIERARNAAKRRDGFPLLISADSTAHDPEVAACPVCGCGSCACPETRMPAGSPARHAGERHLARLCGQMEGKLHELLGAAADHDRPRRQRKMHEVERRVTPAEGYLDATPYFSHPAIWRQIGDSDKLNAQATVGGYECLLLLPSKIASAPEFHMTSTRRCAVPPS